MANCCQIMAFHDCCWLHCFWLVHDWLVGQIYYCWWWWWGGARRRTMIMIIIIQRRFGGQNRANMHISNHKDTRRSCMSIVWEYHRSHLLVPYLHDLHGISFRASQALPWAPHKEGRQRHWDANLTRKAVDPKTSKTCRMLVFDVLHPIMSGCSVLGAWYLSNPPSESLAMTEAME